MVAPKAASGSIPAASTQGHLRRDRKWPFSIGFPPTHQVFEDTYSIPASCRIGNSILHLASLVTTSPCGGYQTFFCRRACTRIH